LHHAQPNEAEGEDGEGGGFGDLNFNECTKAEIRAVNNYGDTLLNYFNGGKPHIITGIHN
jgi:hypothetical protein